MQFSEEGNTSFSFLQAVTTALMMNILTMRRKNACHVVSRDLHTHCLFVQ